MAKSKKKIVKSDDTKKKEQKNSGLTFGRALDKILKEGNKKKEEKK